MGRGRGGMVVVFRGGWVIGFGVKKGGVFLRFEFKVVVSDGGDEVISL